MDAVGARLWCCGVAGMVGVVDVDGVRLVGRILRLLCVVSG